MASWPSMASIRKRISETSSASCRPTPMPAFASSTSPGSTVRPGSTRPPALRGLLAASPSEIGSMASWPSMGASPTRLPRCLEEHRFTNRQGRPGTDRQALRHRTGDQRPIARAPPGCPPAAQPPACFGVPHLVRAATGAHPRQERPRQSHALRSRPLAIVHPLPRRPPRRHRQQCSRTSDQAD
jgi:hypothetical protein